MTSFQNPARTVAIAAGVLGGSMALLGLDLLTVRSSSPFVAPVLLVLGPVLLAVSWSRWRLATTYDQVMGVGERWTYTPEEWKEYVATRRGLEKARTRGGLGRLSAMLGLPLALFLFPVVLAGMTDSEPGSLRASWQAGRFLFAVWLGVVVLVGLVGAASWLRKRRLDAHPSDAFISEFGVVFRGQVYPFGLGGSCLIGVELVGRRLLRLTVQEKVRGDVTHYETNTIEIPVPRAAHESAERLRRELRPDTGGRAYD